MSDTPHTEGHVAPQAQLAARDLDLADVPMDSLVAYWLSLSKLAAERGGPPFLASEAEATSERYVGFLLAQAGAGTQGDVLLRQAEHRRKLVLADYRRAFSCMRMAALSAAGSERPRQTLIAMLALYPVRPLPEARIAQLSKELYQAISSGQDDALSMLAVNSGDKPDRLLVKLLTCVLIARKDGAEGIRAILPRMGCVLLHDGLGLAADGFSSCFLEKYMTDLAAELLYDTALKMDLCDEMALGLAAGQQYEQLYRQAQAFL